MGPAGFFLAVGTLRGMGSTEVPQRGPEAEPRWGYGANPQKLTTCFENNAQIIVY